MNTYDLDLLAKNLNANNIEFLKFDTKEDVAKYLKANLTKDMQIAWGGSKTLVECDILDYLRREKFPKLLDRDDPNLSDDEWLDIERKTFFSDVYLTSANALSEDGLIVNVDGRGNRVAATIFGPKKVYFVVGINKVVKDYAGALRRIKTVAAPLNARRVEADTPCVKTGICQNCNSEHRICNYTVTIKRNFNPGRTCVLLVNESLGM